MVKGYGSHTRCDDEVVLLSKDDRSLSEEQVKSWVDNYKSSLNRKK
jgi:hypothetical protein